MAYETLRYIHIASAALAALALFAAAVIFIALDIPRAAGSVLGITPKRGGGKAHARTAPGTGGETAPLRREGAEATTKLPPEGRGAGDAAPPLPETAGASAFEVEYDITYVHTDEAITGQRGE
jgi:hypothetical protein